MNWACRLLPLSQQLDAPEMSYDFLLLPRDPGQQVVEANERLTLEEGDRALSTATRTRLEQIADRLQAHGPQLERLTTERYIELTRVDDTGIQPSLFSVSWPSRSRTGIRGRPRHYLLLTTARLGGLAVR